MARSSMTLYRVTSSSGSSWAPTLEEAKEIAWGRAACSSGYVSVDQLVIPFPSTRRAICALLNGIIEAEDEQARFVVQGEVDE